MIFFRLDQRGASFETPATRALQDEDGFAMPSGKSLILRSACKARLKGRKGGFAAK